MSVLTKIIVIGIGLLGLISGAVYWEDCCGLLWEAIAGLVLGCRCSRQAWNKMITNGCYQNII